MPTESHALGLNDVSMLLQLAPGADATTFVRMSGFAGTGDLVPRDLFARLVTTPGDVMYDYDAFQVLAIRFDLCDRVAPGACPAGADGQLRLVLQPVLTAVSALPYQAADVGLHAFYPIPAAELAPVVNELRALARIQDFQTASPLAVNPTLSYTAPPSQYEARLQALVARYAVADRLVRLTLLAQDAGAPSQDWVFRGVEQAGGSFQDIMIPTISATQQRVILDENPWPPSYNTTPVADVPAGLLTALDSPSFTAATEAQRVSALGALAIAQNPTMTTTQTEQCVGCHVSTYLTERRAMDANLPANAIEGTFTSARNLSIGFGVSVGTDTSVHNFGWAADYPAISQRVANETAIVLDEIDQRFPPATTPPMFDAGVPDALPTVKRVFVESEVHPGDLKTAGNGADGLDGADRLCAAAAANGHLGGQWVAWLSTSAVNAIDRITGDGPWYLVDTTTLVFANKAAILSSPMHGIDHDEYNAIPDVSSEDAWTGTKADGTVATGVTCSDWTTSAYNAGGMSGLDIATDAGWTAYGGATCSSMLQRLYCFER